MDTNGWQLLALIGAAFFGGYLFAVTGGIALGGLLTHSREEAVLAGTLLSFALYAGAVIWVFTVRRPGRVWLGLILASALLAMIGLALKG
ncbi:MAG: DUF3649 domain-containing protein [Aquisalimonadaceae bacterium]